MNKIVNSTKSSLQNQNIKNDKTHELANPSESVKTLFTRASLGAAATHLLQSRLRASRRFTLTIRLVEADASSITVASQRILNGCIITWFVKILRPHRGQFYWKSATTWSWRWSMEVNGETTTTTNSLFCLPR